jgi:NADPH:quinone reductase-like Zn-dependent oxidoreductase
MVQGDDMGTFAIQIAKYFGTEVIGVCSTTNLELIKSLGTDKVVDHPKKDFIENGEIYDVIFDAVHKTSVSRSKRSPKTKGFYLSVKGSASAKTEDLIFLKELIEAGKIKRGHRETLSVGTSCRDPQVC